MPSRFRSKVDLFLMAPVAIALVLPPILMLGAVTAGQKESWVLVVPFAALVIVACVLNVSYEVTDEDIVVHRGPFRSRMPLRRVQGLRATRDWVSSPALSLDRIEIRTDRGLWLVVSPADKTGFVRAIRARVPSVRLEGLEERS